LEFEELKVESQKLKEKKEFNAEARENTGATEATEKNRGTIYSCPYLGSIVPGPCRGAL
jgi:hypothetical protein